jgi:hypothetical protein
MREGTLFPPLFPVQTKVTCGCKKLCSDAGGLELGRNEACNKMARHRARSLWKPPKDLGPSAQRLLINK